MSEDCKGKDYVDMFVRSIYSYSNLIVMNCCG